MHGSTEYATYHITIDSVLYYTRYTSVLRYATMLWWYEARYRMVELSRTTGMLPTTTNQCGYVQRYTYRVVSSTALCYQVY